MVKVDSKKCVLVLLQIFLISNQQISSVFSEYENQDDPECRSDCDSLTDLTQQAECQKKYLEFYSYKLVKSVFNFAKVSIFAGLWVSRYKDADPNLFENILLSNLNSYNDSTILGQLEFASLNQTAMFIYEKFKKYAKPISTDEEVPYEAYPSLKCPIPCTYELVTWQTLFGISLSIFLLSAITISLYSVFLRKQYNTLRTRIKNVKYINPNITKVES